MFLAKQLFKLGSRPCKQVQISIDKSDILDSDQEQQSFLHNLYRDLTYFLVTFAIICLCRDPSVGKQFLNITF